MRPGTLTLANRITLLRILLIPLFVLAVVYHAEAWREGRPSELLRLAAIILFATASVTDALDGYVARSRGERTRLGTFLDPVADKALLITSLILLSLDHGGAFPRLPTWFPVLVISRDAVLVIGVVLIHLLGGRVVVRPTLAGKAATFFQMITIGWALCGLPERWLPIPTYAAGAFTLISGIQYVWHGTRLLNVDHKAESL